MRRLAGIMLGMDEHIYKNHNKTLLLYHFVFPVKYRRKIFTKEVGEKLKEVCERIGEAYEMKFIEIGMEEDHVHMLVQGSDANGDEDKKHNCERNLQGVPENQTGHTMGRESMDERILREHGRTVCEQGDDSQIHTEPREESKGLREDTRPTAGA